MQLDKKIRGQINLRISLWCNLGKRCRPHPERTSEQSDQVETIDQSKLQNSHPPKVTMP